MHMTHAAAQPRAASPLEPKLRARLHHAHLAKALPSLPPPPGSPQTRTGALPSPSSLPLTPS